MKTRRSFLAGLLAAPLALVGLKKPAPVSTPGIRVLSCWNEVERDYALRGTGAITVTTTTGELFVPDTCN